MNYRALLILVTLWTALLARVGSRDTFYYKKSKTAIRKDRDNLTRTERFLAKYDTAPTHAPFHTKLFLHFRLYNYALCVISVVSMQIIPQYAAIVFYVKVFASDTKEVRTISRRSYRSRLSSCGRYMTGFCAAQASA